MQAAVSDDINLNDSIDETASSGGSDDIVTDLPVGLDEGNQNVNNDDQGIIQVSSYVDTYVPRGIA